MFSHLEPVPRFESWDYREILTAGIRPLIEKEPYNTACILISAVAMMTCLEMHQDQIEKDGDEDYSEVWYPRLSGKYEGYGEPKELLIYTMTSACEQVYEEDPDSIEDLDKQLRKQRWKLFKRLRQHLYAHYPTQQTKPWILDSILLHEDYARTEDHHEFQLMVRNAFEHFNGEFLTIEVLASIFERILSGPSKDDFQESLGEHFSEELFEKRQRHFHRMQLKLFETVLFGDYLSYFQELECEADEQISEEDYSPISETEAQFISRRSPRSPQELAALSDKELLNYINAWQDERPYEVDEDGSLADICVEGLAEAFQSAFKEEILPNNVRIQFWMENRGQVERPIYVRAIIDGMRKYIEEMNFERLDESLEFCEWVLEHPDQERDDTFGYGDKSREDPHWARSRRAVESLVRTCTNRETNAPISARGRLGKLLELLCTQFDWQLDKHDPDFFGSNDYLTTAINNTRSRAFDCLVDYGSWLRENEPEADVAAVTITIEKRFAPESEYPLTLPERAILGGNYMRLVDLDEAWAFEHRPDFFPRHELNDWRQAFGGFLRRHRPHKLTFGILRKEYSFAAQHIGEFKGRDDSDSEFSDYLGRHLFFYYLWGLFPLIGEESLLERFYLGTREDRKRWSNLVDRLGLKLENTKEDLEEDTKRGLIDFFEWRLEAGDTDELGHFSIWLKAECLEAEWRLDAFSRVLDSTKGSTSQAVSITAKALEEMLPGHTNKVVECFSKLTDAPKDSAFYVGTATAKRIIHAGLGSTDEDTRKTAKRALENLLRRGFDLLSLQD